jgi:hypothetical protein
MFDDEDHGKINLKCSNTSEKLHERYCKRLTNYREHQNDCSERTELAKMMLTKQEVNKISFLQKKSKKDEDNKGKRRNKKGDKPVVRDNNKMI